MNTYIFKLVALFATVLIFVVFGLYAWNFGMPLSNSQDSWGQFGDYFGGTLNPIFGMLAFLALLWSITLQTLEFNQAIQHLSDQTRLAREEAGFARKDKLSLELLEVIKDIDARIGSILATEISILGTSCTSISYMASEAERLSTTDDSSPSYESFLKQAQTKGSIVEASTRELLHLVEKMREFITDYSNAREGAYAPIIVYYADKVFHLLHLVHDLGGAQPDTFHFFSKVADPDR